MLDDPLDTEAAKHAFVATYNSRGFEDPWDIIEAYETVLEATGKHPQKGSAAISRIVDLLRSTIRRWVDDAVPYRFQSRFHRTLHKQVQRFRGAERNYHSRSVVRRELQSVLSPAITVLWSLL